MHSVNNGQKIRKTGMIKHCTSKYMTVHDREANGFYGWRCLLPQCVGCSSQDERVEHATEECIQNFHFLY